MIEANGYTIKDQTKPHFITATVVDWVDVFSRKVYKDIVLNSLEYCTENKGMILYGYVIMSNHIHLIIQSENGKLSNLIRDFKKFTSKSILEEIHNNKNESRKDWMLKRFEFAGRSHSRNESYQLWQYGSHPEEIFSEKFFWSKLDYIHQNPVRAGIVEQPEHYIHSSASNYIENRGLIKIEKVDIPIVDVLKPSSITRYLQ
jgi:REP element-mobilizing transposase RayT